MIELAKSAGFCSGVRRAFDIAVTAAHKHGRAYTLGELVHNEDALAILHAQGVYAIGDVSELPDKSTQPAVVIRSHGVSRAVYEELERSGAIVYDATCPYVKKIHNIVSEINEPNSHIVIMGDKNHPEVRGIVGHVKCAYAVVNSPEELREVLRLQKKVRHIAQFLVAQTTFNERKWRDCIKIVNNLYTNAKIFDTICYATIKRQNEARILSKNSNIMVVIGSKRSSNSVKLYEISAEGCSHTFFITNAGALQNVISATKREISIAGARIPYGTVAVGITAGASVPTEIIMEVHNKMNEEIMRANEADAEGAEFMAEVEKTLPQKLYIGKRVKAFVVAVNANEVVVDLGVKQSGYIPADEIGGEPGSNPDDVVKPGDEIDCIVTKVNDAEGVIHLSKKSVDNELGFEKLTVAYNADAVIEGYVAAVVNSGVIVTYEGSRVFIPASQSGVPRGGDLATLLKQTVQFKVIEVNEQRKRLVGSIRAASKNENDAVKAKFWEEIEVGKAFTGEVKSIENYGVFVDLGGVDGMVHLSELSWKRIRHPKDAVSLGDTLSVVVKSFDPEKRRVSLTAKNPDENPWAKFVEAYQEGSIAKATIVNLTQFGAFAQIIPGVDGLIHISQISGERVNNVADVLQVGQEVEVKVTEIDEARERISLSMRAVNAPETAADEVAQAEGDE
ncbi:MAG: bifunctional 4-hydroxy-3-methylbut-2-enyl diphosphate reductase/30S ribosomal protein S1 [Oscillospiraceae bacterium]|nr:bifunctional 4-hydroxy-3-methylbut-2-enyl diphosphate reductase/30S ribosomal protein S1 [Oscillospiraceae bacterium]